MLELNSDPDSNFEVDKPQIERRNGLDRRDGKDRRYDVRYEPTRRKNHGRREDDRDLWKESLEFE